MKPQKFILNHTNIFSIKSTILNLLIIIIAVLFYIFFREHLLSRYIPTFLLLDVLTNFLISIKNGRIKIIELSEYGISLFTLKENKFLPWNDIIEINENFYKKGMYFYSFKIVDEQTEEEIVYLLQKTEKTSLCMESFYQKDIRKIPGSDVYQAVNWIKDTLQYAIYLILITVLIFLIFYILLYQTGSYNNLISTLLYTFIGVLIFEVIFSMKKLIKYRRNGLVRNKQGITVFENSRAHFIPWADIRGIKSDEIRFNVINNHNVTFYVKDACNYNYDSIIMESSQNYYYNSVLLKAAAKKTN